MSWSLLNHTLAERVDALLDAASEGNDERHDFKPAMRREVAAAIIHAALWAHAARAGSTAAAYAMMNLLRGALRLERWEFMPEPPPAEPAMGVAPASTTDAVQGSPALGPSDPATTYGGREPYRRSQARNPRDAEAEMTRAPAQVSESVSLSRAATAREAPQVVEKSRDEPHTNSEGGAS